MIRKKIIKTLIVIFLIILNLDVVYAEDFFGGTTGAGISAPPGVSGGGGKCNSGTGGPQKSCGIKDEFWRESVSISESIYDTNGEYLGEAFLLQDTNKFVSGRFIGIDAFEEYKKKYTVSINPSCVDIYVICTKRTKVSKTCTGISYAWRDSDGVVHYEYYDYDCSYWVTDTKKSDTTCDEGYSAECHSRYCDPDPIWACRGEAEQELATLVKDVKTEPSFVGKRQDVNDIASGVDSKGEPILAIDDTIPYYGSVQILDPEPEDRNSPEVSQTVYLRYTYNVQKACIDPVTSKVVYVRAVNSKGEPDEEPCPKNYIAVPEIKSVITPYSNFEGLHVGQYYIPLNAKSTDTIKYNLTYTPSSRKIAGDLCKVLIEKYKDDEYERWKGLLVDSYGLPFEKTTTVQEGIRRTSGGCYMVYYATFRIKGPNDPDDPGEPDNPIYNDNGYGYYYRPIDYTNPFPNGLNQNSFWVGLINLNNPNLPVTVKDANGKTTVNNLADSFKKVTYRTNNDFDLNKIREYNGKHDNLFGSVKDWEKMTLSGESKFISGSYGLERKSCATFYALGCGPANSNWQECIDRQRETCKE